MSISASLLPEFDQEMANTRKTLERVPTDKFTYKPHPKSGEMIWLAGHVANLLSWATMTMTTTELDLSPDGKPYTPPPSPATAEELLALFDTNRDKARAAIAAAADDDYMIGWSLLMTGKTLFTMPRIAVLRSFVINHMIHHRAQLTMYLRLNDIAVPALYGPSADEGQMG
ncbi:MAG: DinB family protein [Acidobacteria bacterium]|nr:DinB family protein [Acidobacteriota bacterium]